ncbi:MAG: hypothetical protein ABIR26_06715 [Ramlibacter sp.]
MLCLLAACFAPSLASAEKQTVCTITVNSDDEQKTFRKYLSPDKYQFVELVERNRKDWLASSCQAKVSCDMLIISGHYGEGNEFFSDALEAREHLPIAELERVSCSGSCPSLFANLKEVYLFGCDTLKSQAQHSTSGEIQRSFVREGATPAEAERLAKLLNTERGEASRDRMRLVFKDVPVIYGFSSAAPLGPLAASSLARYFQASGTGEIGKGRPSGSLLRQFSANGMVAARGMTAGDNQAGVRKDICRFADDRMTDGQRLDFVHEVLQRPGAQARMMLDRIEQYTDTLDDSKRRQAEVAQSLQRIGSDAATRDRYLAFARDADRFEVRARMIDVAHDLGWLTPDERKAELTRMLGEMLARKVVEGPDVDLACALNKERVLDGAIAGIAPQSRGAEDDVGHSAVRACLGSAEAHAATLKGLVSPSDADVRIAQAYLRQRPIADANEVRALTAAIAGMNETEAQARALDVLARHYLSDRESVNTLKQLYSKTRSWPVQNAIAGVLIRADPRSLANPELLRTLREHRLKSSPGDTMVDALIQRLQLS